MDEGTRFSVSKVNPVAETEDQSEVEDVNEHLSYTTPCRAQTTSTPLDISTIGSQKADRENKGTDDTHLAPTVEDLSGTTSYATPCGGLTTSPLSDVRTVGCSVVSRHSISCGSIFWDYTTFQDPDVDGIVCGMARAAHDMMRKTRHSPHLSYLFDEHLFPLPINPLFDTGLEIPIEEVLYDFMDSLFALTNFSAHCAVAIQIYLTRLLNHTGVDLHASNWRWIFIGLTLLVSKMWVDWGFQNSSYAAALSVGQSRIDELERYILFLLDFDLGVTKAEFTAYFFFNLRCFGAPTPVRYDLLTTESAVDLDGFSVTRRRANVCALRRSKSADDLRKQRKLFSCGNVASPFTFSISFFPNC